MKQIGALTCEDTTLTYLSFKLYYTCISEGKLDLFLTWDHLEVLDLVFHAANLLSSLTMDRVV